MERTASIATMAVGSDLASLGPLLAAKPAPAADKAAGVTPTAAPNAPEFKYAS